MDAMPTVICDDAKKDPLGNEHEKVEKGNNGNEAAVEGGKPTPEDEIKDVKDVKATPDDDKKKRKAGASQPHSPSATLSAPWSIAISEASSASSSTSSRGGSSPS